MNEALGPIYGQVHQILESVRSAPSRVSLNMLTDFGATWTSIRESQATKEATTLALDLATRAQGNIESCKDNYRGRRYADAAEDLQQAVEKAAKAFGLLTGTVRPTDAEMWAVGHDSFKAFVLHFWDFYPKLVALMAAESNITTSELLDNFVDINPQSPV